MQKLKEPARRIFTDVLAAIDIPRIMHRALDCSGTEVRVGLARVDLSRYDRILAIAIGKASAAMAKGLVEVLGPERGVEGILVTPSDALQTVAGFRTIGAGHPLPDAGSLLAASEILQAVRRFDGERSLIFFLLSGGGSAMIESPLNRGLALGDLRRFYQLLVECGAPIDQINTVRKHVSAVKGGRLAVAAPRAMKITLAVSDVPQGMESALASGPTLPDPTTIADACDVIRRYELSPRLPSALRATFDNPAGMEETPKAGHPAFDRSLFFVLLETGDLFREATRSAELEDCAVLCDNSTDDWPVGQAADFLIEKVANLLKLHPGRRVAVIAGGELSSPVIGSGVGGRNSAFVLDCVRKIAGRKIAVLSAGTDGRDGSSPAAGAVADGETLRRAIEAGLDPDDFFRRSDSYSFFQLLDDAIQTGPTGINLRDLRILIAE